MCNRGPERDEHGRLRRGSTANPRGRRLSPVGRLLAAAEAAGAEISIKVPARQDADATAGPATLPAGARP